MGSQQVFRRVRGLRTSLLRGVEGPAACQVRKRPGNNPPYGSECAPNGYVDLPA